MKQNNNFLISTKVVEVTIQRLHNYAVDISVLSAIFLMCLMLFFPIFFGKSLYPITFAGRTTEPTDKDTSLSKAVTRPTYFDSGASDWIEIPMNEVFTSYIRKGQFILWNPYNSLGMPVIPNINGSQFAPLQLSLWLFGGSDFSWDLIYIIRLYFTIASTYVFLRYLHLSRFSSLLGCLSYGLSGYMVNFLNIFHLNVDAFLPLMMLSFEMFAQKTTFKRWLFLILTIDCLILGGNPQNLIIISAFCFSFYVLRLFYYGKATYQNILKVIAAYIVAVGLVAWYVFPFVELFKLALQIHTNYGTAYLSNYKYLLGILGPIFPIYPTGESGSYLHNTSVFLLSFAISNFRRISPKKRGIVIWASLSIILYLLKIMGFPLLNYLGNLPIINLLGFLKYNSIVYFAFAMIFALYVDEARFKDRISYSKLIFVYFVLYSLYAFAILPGFSFDSIFNIPTFFHTDIKNTIFYTFVFVSISTAILYKVVHIKKHKYVSIIILALVLVELSWQIMYYNNFRINRGVAFRESKYVTQIRENQSQPYTRTFSIGFNLFGNLSSLWGLYDISGISATHIESQFLAIKKLILNNHTPLHFVVTRSDTFHPKSLPILSLLNVEFLILTEGHKLIDPGLKQIYAGEGVVVYKNLKIVPRVFVPDSLEYSLDLNTILDRLTHLKNPESTLLLFNNDKKGKDDLIMQSKSKGSSVVIEKYEPNFIKINAKMNSYSYIVLSDVYFPGWIARIDGKDVELLSAYGFLRAVAVPKGNHVVEFIYKPSSVYIGLYLSITFLVILISYPFIKIVRKNL